MRTYKSLSHKISPSPRPIINLYEIIPWLPPLWYYASPDPKTATLAKCILGLNPTIIYYDRVMECVGGHIAAICRWCRCKIDDLKREKRDVFFSLIVHGFHNSASIRLQDPLGCVSSTLLCSDNPLPPLWRTRCRGPALCMQSPRRIFALDLTDI